MSVTLVTISHTTDSPICVSVRQGCLSSTKYLDSFHFSNLGSFFVNTSWCDVIIPLITPLFAHECGLIICGTTETENQGINVCRKSIRECK